MPSSRDLSEGERLWVTGKKQRRQRKKPEQEPWEGEWICVASEKEHEGGFVAPLREGKGK